MEQKKPPKNKQKKRKKCTHNLVQIQHYLTCKQNQETCNTDKTEPLRLKKNHLTCIMAISRGRLNTVNYHKKAP